MKKKILIVEDEEMLSKVLVEQFEKAGFDVEAAFDGEKALKSLEKSKPDLVLLDIILPKINGFDVLKAIKENPDTQDIPVIMISNLGRDEDIKQSIKLGAVDYYIKAQHPIFEIIEKVSNFLSLPKSPLEKPKAPAKEKKVVAAAPLEAAEEKPVEVKKVLEKPIEKVSEEPVKKSLEIIVEKPTEKAIEKLVEKVVEKPKIIEKPVEKIVEKLIEEVAEKPVKKIVEKPKKEVVKKPFEEAGGILGKIIDIVEDSAKKVVKKPIEKVAEKPKAVEKPELKKVEAKPPIVVVKKPIEKNIKAEEKKFPQLPRSARKFIRIKKSELNKMDLTPEERKEKVAKLYQIFSPNKK